MHLGRSTTTTVPQRRRTEPEELVRPAVARFEIGRRLGDGGMGVVFEARHVLLRRRVALKFTHPAADSPLIARARLMREGQALARVVHPNVVTLFEIGVTAELVFLEMELVEGGTLADWIQTPRTSRDIVDMFLMLGGGLAAVHDAGLVHRDIKPSNILVDRRGTPKIGDFGVAVSGPAYDAGSTVGTPAYMPPEQARGEPVDARADQFAFCTSLHEALTGRLPGDPDVRRPVPHVLRPILARGLSADPVARFPAMGALLDALSRARSGEQLAIAVAK